MPKYEKVTKRTAVALSVLLSVVTVIAMLPLGEPKRVVTAAGTILLVLLPMAAEKLFRCRISLPVYLFAVLYALGPMVGHCWYIYYTTSWWDKLLHFAGGVMFAILGAVCFDGMAQGKQKPIVGVLFAFCFSVTIAALWEFAEFGMDTFLGMDMQNDTVVTRFTSYLLGPSVGITGSIENIQSVAVNGTVLPFEGYLDIGIIDTMLDMLLETAGALLLCLGLWLDKGRHPMLTARREE